MARLLDTIAPHNNSTLTRRSNTKRWILLTAALMALLATVHCVTSAEAVKVGKGGNTAAQKVQKSASPEEGGHDDFAHDSGHAEEGFQPEASAAKAKKPKGGLKKKNKKATPYNSDSERGGSGSKRKPIPFKDIKVKNVNNTAKAKTLAKTQIKLLMEKEIAFLEGKRKDPTVRKLPSGLLFKIIKKGTGLKSPNAADPVEIRYTATLAQDGSVFDSTDAPNPAANPAENKVKGWLEALELMREGDVWELYMPHHLAFGVDGVEGVVPQYSAVAYRLELFKVLGTGGHDAEDNEAVFLRHFGKEYADL